MEYKREPILPSKDGTVSRKSITYLFKRNNYGKETLGKRL
jgi:hypothetical protein